MINFFQASEKLVFAVHAKQILSANDIDKLVWALGNAKLLQNESIDGFFIGPRKEMVTPWSTNAVEITQNMGISGIIRIEEFQKVENQNASYDPMLQRLYVGLNQFVFTIETKAQEIIYIDDIQAYNKSEGLALSQDEVEYLNSVSKDLGRKLTDSEVFGFSQVNSEHCRHKIFNGRFIIDGEEKPNTLFELIKATSKANPQNIISAYKDNVAFLKGPKILQFAPKTHHQADFFEQKQIDSIISLKAETHNFPTTVEPFNGAATGSGGEIRDRMAGGIGSLPLAGTAVYMTSYPRLETGKFWEQNNKPRKWLYQTPEEILIKASNGASDFGNKFGQPLICGSVLTFEHAENEKVFGYDKVIMQAGGIGFARLEHAQKRVPEPNQKLVLLGGDNYRIGMGGGAVSSVATGEFKSDIELNAVQRSNPEMQKRAYNAIRAFAESDENPIISLHDHGAGGHLNCLSELVENTGGLIHLDKLPIGDPTLSAKELIGNESQERMGLVIENKHVETFRQIAERERSPMYVIGETTGDMQFTFKDEKGNAPIDMQLAYLFGNPPKTVLVDSSKKEIYNEIIFQQEKLQFYIEQVLQIEAVAAKDWLTNKVDRSVTGRVALQQTAGEIQLPLNNLGISALDYEGKSGIATSLGHAPVSALLDPEKGSKLAIAEALTNIVWAPLTGNLSGVALSANWMWPAKNEGENARLYNAVQAISDFSIALGISVPTGKDSLSMTQKYSDGVVFSPGTVIISAVAEVSDLQKTVTPVLKNIENSEILYIDFSSSHSFEIGGSSFAQTLDLLGTKTPDIENATYFATCFNALQELIENGKILAGHDISAGGMITTLLEMNFANTKSGLKVDLSAFDANIIEILFSEKPSVLIQVQNSVEIIDFFTKKGILAQKIAVVNLKREFSIQKNTQNYVFDVDALRKTWFKTSYLLDRKQSGEILAKQRFENFDKQILAYKFKADFSGEISNYWNDTTKRTAKAAIIREKGVNGDREMAFSLYKAGFAVKDVHMTDLISGREDLSDVNMIVFVGGFSNSDVLGSAKGWAGAFLYNEKAKMALINFYARKDTLSLGVCNGCQLMVELDLIQPNHEKKAKMLHNESHKFESAFLTVDVLENESIMLKSLSNTKLGIWVAHGEGKFDLPYDESRYNIAMKYSYAEYPANPNGSDYNTAAICSADGRHLAMMPHLERAIMPWQWANYPENRKDQVTPWLEAFANARLWIENKH